MIHIILAHTVFLSGIVLGFRFSLLLNWFFVILYRRLNYFDANGFWGRFVIYYPRFMARFLLGKTHLFLTLKRKSYFVKEMIEDQEYNRRTEDEK